MSNTHPNAKPILMIGSSLANKGGITSVIDLYRTTGLMDQVDYLTTTQDGPTLLKLWRFLCFLVSFITRLTRNPNIQVVHLHVSQRGSVVRKTIASLIAKRWQKTVLWHMHGSEFTDWYHGSPSLVQQLIRWAVTRADGIICLSHQRKTDLLAIIPEAHVTVLYNPCLLQPPETLSIFSPLKRQQDIHNGDAVRFLFMGRYGKRKGVFDLVTAVRLANHPQIHVSLYGDANRRVVQNMVDEYRLGKAITVGDWISGETKHQAFLNADVLVLPSYNEGLPMAILEAMSYGLPVITTPVGGIAEAVEEGENGFLIQPGDVTNLANKLLYFIKYPEQLSVMGQRSYSRAADTFELGGVVQQLQTLYGGILTPRLNQTPSAVPKGSGQQRSSQDAYPDLATAGASPKT